METLTVAGHDVDRDPVAELFRAHYAELLRLAVLFHDDRASAEDAVMDAFARLHERWDRLRDHDKALAYLRTCVANAGRSRVRRLLVARRRPHLPAPDAASAEEASVLREDHAEVLAALAALPPRQRQVLALRYWLDLTVPQIAATLGISEGAVKSHAHRAMAAVTAALEARR